MVAGATPSTNGEAILLSLRAMDRVRSVSAADDALVAEAGVVLEARRWSGYGNWLRVRHAGGWDTGYGHISRYAPGIHAGSRVRQGQVVAYVGSTGSATGPHLHYEVWLKGKRVNPVGAKVPQGTVLAGAELARFRAEKIRVERLLETNLASAD